MKKARFHLPGLRANFALNMLWASMLERQPDWFREDVEIGSFFGVFPTALWNGGRLAAQDQCDAASVRYAIEQINARGIPIRYTFNNTTLTEEDLSDPFCNFLMDEANNGMNEVIVASPVLEQYLRTKYPGFSYISSTCKEIKLASELADELRRDYKYVVLDYNLNGRWDILENVGHPEKLEILVNALCPPNCPRRGEHYRTIGQNQKAAVKNAKLPPERRAELLPWDCPYEQHNTVWEIQSYPTVVKPDEIWTEYLPRGISNFKLEGRTENLFPVIDTYCLYMLKPERMGTARLQLIRNLEEQGFLRIARPRAGVWP